MALGGLLLAGLAGYRGQDQKTFLAERRAEAVGYRIEHFERERLLFVRHGNGEKDGVELAVLRGVFLRRQKASDSVDGKTRFFWDFGGPERVVSAPFFSAEPRAVIGILGGELTGFDGVSAMRMATAFERNEASFCLPVVGLSGVSEGDPYLKREEECRP